MLPRASCSCGRNSRSSSARVRRREGSPYSFKRSTVSDAVDNASLANLTSRRIAASCTGVPS